MKFTLSLPPTLNSTYRIGGKDSYSVKGNVVVGSRKSHLYKSKEAVEWQEEAFLTIKMERPETVHSPFIIINWFINNPLRDIDAGEKIILDTLQLSQVIINDNQIYDKYTKKNISKLGELVEVSVFKNAIEFCGAVIKLNNL